MRISGIQKEEKRTIKPDERDFRSGRVTVAFEAERRGADVYPADESGKRRGGGIFLWDNGGGFEKEGRIVKEKSESYCKG